MEVENVKGCTNEDDNDIIANAMTIVLTIVLTIVIGAIYRA